MFQRIKNAATKCRNAVARVGTKVAAATASLFFVTGNAMAASGTFDSSSIIAKIEANAAEAVLIIGAFILAVWGLRAMGLLGKRG